MSTPNSYNPEQAKTLVGTVERVTYNNSETGYTIARLKVSGEPDPVTIVGHFSAITPGETLRMAGFWVTHRTYGPQFKVANYEVCKPATIAGIEKYLGSGLIKGIGPVTAKRIVEKFKEKTLDVIEQEIERLNEVPGIAKKRVSMIARAWAEQQAIKEVMLFLQSHGVTTHFAVKIFKEYGPLSIQTVSENPYRLAQDIYGIGFKTADQIAQNLGIRADSEERIRAGFKHVLHEATESGHCYLPADALVTEGEKVLSITNHDLLHSVAEKMAREDEIKAERGFRVQGSGCREETQSSVLSPQSLEESSVLYYLPGIWQAEQNVARWLRGLLARPVEFDEKKVAAWLEQFTKKEKLELSAEQKEAILTASRHRVMVLTGGPGCGKTTTLRAMVKMFRHFNRRVELASPTGRAAQRLSEVAGVEARTIHRLLAYDPAQHGFTRNADNPLETDVVIVDEASMLDVLLASNLLKAIPTIAQLVLVGDVDQLPSVGPGRVLSDIINSDVIPVIRLTQVFRQAQGSVIITNAHRIREGHYPKLIEPGSVENTDCYYIPAEEPEDIHRLLINAVTRSLPKRFGYDPLTDIQVLTPMNRSSVGAAELNLRLQQHLNPPAPDKEQIERMGRIFREGDKVIQKVNNYNLEVFNGDVGLIRQIDTEDHTCLIEFGDRDVTYDWADLNELGHGFAMSVHKSQGSEYPAVVIILHTQAWMVLSRNLIYTALTRAKKTAVLLGTKKALGAAMRKIEAGTRNTRLAEILPLPIE
ncbi:MAG: ATP-dependent RecD-like DNA helicase [Blastocatellia bacterium]|nr:ATP-dependent RecD-like DNA helicase [Blastocatellia bacterium]